MRFGIVEGEPGIFPDPIARLLRLPARLFRRNQTEDAEPSDDAESTIDSEGQPDTPSRGGRPEDEHPR